MNSKKYKVGMYGGKFMPFHKGHLFCIEEAAKLCDKLYVILFHGGDQEIAILRNRNEKFLTFEDRIEHTKNACKNMPNVIVTDIDVTYCKNSDGSENWDMETPLVEKVCGKIDAVFGSENDYEDYYSRAYPQATYIKIDTKRINVPISATMLRGMSDKEREKWIV